MLKNVWIYATTVAIVAIAGAGGWIYFEHHQQANVTAPAAESEAARTAAAPRQDDELARKRREGIGSIKDLKPVPIER